jgi:hypothetical protein
VCGANEPDRRRGQAWRDNCKVPVHHLPPDASLDAPGAHRDASFEAATSLRTGTKKERLADGRRQP